jgi:hypothetical protein
MPTPAANDGRVEMWCGGVRSGLSVTAPFVWRCPGNLAVAPFPHPAHRTGRADFPHPALFQNIKPSHSHGRCSPAAGVSVNRYSACCHHYPGGTVECVPRSLLGRHRPSSLLWRVGFHDDISRPAQCSFALRPAEPADLLRGRFKECFSAFVTSWTAPCASGRSESWPGRICTDVSTVP